jgi:hypothetical protein
MWTMRADTQEAWAKYASGGHEAMKAIASACAAHDLSVRSFAERAKRDVKVVTRWFASKQPRQETVERACRVLGFNPSAVVARALLGTLEPGDAGDLRDLIGRAIGGLGRESLGFYAAVRAVEVQSWLERQPATVTLDVGRLCALALYSLASPDVDADTREFGPVVGATVSALRAHGYNVFPFMHWRQSDDAKATLALEAQAWTNLLCEALGFEERYYFAPRLRGGRVRHGNVKPAIEATEAEESKAFHSIVGPRLSRARDFIQANVEKSVPEILERFRGVQERLNRAQRAAKRAFRETLYSSESENQP